MALSRSAPGLSAVVIVVFPDHTHYFLCNILYGLAGIIFISALYDSVHEDCSLIQAFQTVKTLMRYHIMTSHWSPLVLFVYVPLVDK